MSLPYLHPYLGLSNGLNTLHAAGGGAGGIGGWVELGRTTLGGLSDTISVGSINDKRYYMILNSIIPSGAVNNVWQWNSDTGSNYAYRYSNNGAADGTSTSASHMFGSAITDSTPYFGVSYIANRSTNEKLGIAHYVQQSTAGAAYAPNRQEIVGKWANTSNAISSLDVKNSSGSADYASGSEVVVLGWDPADTHTNNFWEELYSGTATSGQILDTGNFSGKKYLWIQAIVKGTGNSTSFMRFNSDSGSNYSTRYSNNGSADGTYTSLTSGFEWITSSTPNPAFFNMFIINNASNEKLAIHHCVHNNTSGSSNAPLRFETTQKWANTSNQITSIQLDRGSTGAHTNTILKVWGAD